jgi:hypothetical protein
MKAGLVGPRPGENPVETKAPCAGWHLWIIENAEEPK